MATYYWVGGTGTWDATTTTNWASSSGGAGGAGVPTSADNVIIDDNSGTGTITCTNAVCNDITVTASQALKLGAAAGNTLSVYGSMMLPSGGSFSVYIAAPWTISFAATSTGKTITTNSKTMPSVGFNGVGGGWTLGSALLCYTTNAYISIVNGTLDTAGYNVSAVYISSSGNGTRQLTLNSSVVTLTSVTGNVTFYGNNFTFNCGTSTINCTPGDVGTNNTFAGGGKTFYNVSFTSSTFNTISIADANTFNNLTFATRSTSGVGTVSFNSNQTINGTLSIQSGNTDPSKRIRVISDITTTQRTLTAAAIAINCVDFRDIVGAGAATWDDSIRSKYWGNLLGNSNITFATGRSVYWNLSGSRNWSDNGWAATNNGTPNAQYFPLAQDTATFTEAGSAGTVTINAGWQLGSLQMADGVSNRTTAFTLASGTTTPGFFGNVTLFPNLTLTGTGAIAFIAQSRTQTITSAGVSWTQPITINAPNGTVKTQDALTIASTQTLTLTAGTLDLNNNTLTTGFFISNNSNTRSIAFGTGDITVTGSGVAVFVMYTATGFAYTGTPVVNFTYAGSTGQRAIGLGNSAGGTESNALTYNFVSGSDSLNLQGVMNNVSFTGFSGTLGNAALVIYGDLTIPAGVTLTAGTNATVLGATSGTQKTTVNGQTLDFPITKQGAGTLQLQDALTLGATRTFTHTAGTVDLNGKTLTVPVAYSTSNSNIRAIDFGSGGTISLPGSGTAFNATVATNLTTSGTGTISMTSASAKTFAGGSLDYSGITLNQGGAGALTITGANSFYDITNTVSPATVIFPAGVTTTVTNLSLAGAASTDSTATIPSSLSRLNIGGSSINSGRELNGTIKRIAYYPKRLSNATISALTQI